MSPLEERIRTITVSNQDIRNAVTEKIIKKKPVEEEEFCRIFGNDKTSYLIACYSKNAFEKKKKTRRCGNPAFIHSFGVALLIYDYLTLTLNGSEESHENKAFYVKAAFLHDLIEDIRLEKEEVKGELERIVKATGKDIDTEGIIRILIGVTKVKPKNMNELEYYENVYIAGMVKRAREAYKNGLPYYDGELILKLADIMDNTRTLLQLNEDYKADYFTLQKATVIAKAADELMQSTKPNPYLQALQQELIKTAVKEITRVKEKVLGLITSVRTIYPELTVDYKGTREKAEMLLNNLKKLEDEMLKRQEFPARHKIIHPITGYPYALPPQTPLPLPFHPQPDTSSAA